MVEATQQNSQEEQKSIWHNPKVNHEFLKSKDESPEQLRDRSLKARALGKTLIESPGSYGRGRISDSDLKDMGGKEKFIEMFQYFYYMFMTDPFMNTLFDMTNKDTNLDHSSHGKRLGLFFLTWFGDDDEYY